MNLLRTPGLYRHELETRLPPGPLMRGDVAVLLGYAARGPIMVPVRIGSLTQFQFVFGPALAHGFLWHAVKGFFECGGRNAYIVRLAGPTARAAQADIGGGWRAMAAFSWPFVDPRRTHDSNDAETAIWRNRVETEIREHGLRPLDPGAWGNQLELQIKRASLLITQTVGSSFEHGTITRLQSVARLEVASVLELSQFAPDGTTTLVRLNPVQIEPAFSKVHWPVPLRSLGLDPDDTDHPIRVASVEFDVTLRIAGSYEQDFAGLAPHPDHSRSLAEVMMRQCRSATLNAPFNADLAIDWSDPKNWPGEGMHGMSDGFDGLESITAETWDVGLEQLPGLIDAALIAAPDLMLPEAMLPPTQGDIDSTPDCYNLAPPPPGFLQGQVLSPDETGTQEAVPGVLVDVAGVGASVFTDTDGRFILTDIPLDLVTLRLSKTGFALLETVAQSNTFANQPGPVFSLQKLTTPAVLPVDEQTRLQRAMGNPAVVGPYKVAIIDPPAANTDLEGLQAWRSEMGDAARLGFFAPWLSLPVPSAPTGQLACPPSGHVCGAFAQAEQVEGIQRSGANLPLRYVEGTTRNISDIEQGDLNPVGINAIRAFPGRGIRIFGTRSLSTNPDWHYLTTRRIVDAIERTLERSLAWAVFEPNSEITRLSVQTSAAQFLDRIYRRGILMGTSPQAAFRVKSDLENNPQDSRDQGRMIIDIGVAPTVPFEFIVFRLGHTFDALQVTEKSG